MISLGDKNIKRIMLGDTPIRKVYRGNILIWQENSEPLPPLRIVFPNEGEEIKGNLALFFEVTLSDIIITSPSEGEGVEGNPTINFEIEIETE